MKLLANAILFKHKVSHGLSNKGFIEILHIFKDMPLENNVFPNSSYSIKQFMKTFDLGYQRKDGCINGYCLFRKEKQQLESCPKCGESGWNVNKRKRVENGS